MSFSLNEVEATAKKATRGAGYPWGIAEDAGKATRWLCARGQDGCALLAEVLHKFDGAPLAEITPDLRGGTWAAPGGTLCPLMAGTALADHALIAHPADLRMGAVAVPRMLLPFAALVATQFDAPVTLTWPGGAAITEGASLDLTEEGQTPTAPWLRLARGGVAATPRAALSRATPDPAAWDSLNAFAHRTYAPATEESRRKGAGAGTPDRD